MRRYGATSLPPSPSTIAPVRSRGGRFFLVCWIIYLIATPVYIFESGLPQPADALMAIMILLLATGFALRIPVDRDLYLVAALFLTWVAVINWFWWAHYQDSMFLLSSVYYAYNFATLVTVFALFNRLQGELLSATRIALAVAVLLELMVIFLLPDTLSVRSAGTFNNPNQLGYWSILAGSCYLVARGEASLRWPDLAVLCALAYIAMLSLSKAAMLSFLALLGAALWFQGASVRTKLALGAALMFGAVFVVAGSSVLDAVLSEGTPAVAIERLQGIGEQKDDTPAGRGYDRIWLYPEYLFLGAGEGAYDRFKASMAAGNEMHSTPGTILFSYGLPGLFLFVALCCSIFRRTKMRHVAYFLPICLYGLTHQGLRATLLWVFLGLVFCTTRYPGEVGAVRQPSGPRPSGQAEAAPLRRQQR